MGPVVTINSATLVNKGLEVIEAHLLFDIPIDRIEVVVHPTSVVHSMVEFVDGRPSPGQPADDADPDRPGAELARPGAQPPPRSTGPDRRPGSSSPSTTTRFRGGTGKARPPRSGGTAPAVYNAANEVCVEAFREGRLAFTKIVPTVTDVLSRHDVPLTAGTSLTVEDILAADAWARAEAVRVARSRRKGGREGEQPLLRARRGDLLRRHPGLDRAPRVRPMIPAKAFGGKVTQCFIGFGPTVWSKQPARPSTASRRSRSAATSRSSGCCRPGRSSSPTSPTTRRATGSPRSASPTPACSPS